MNYMEVTLPNYSYVFNFEEEFIHQDTRVWMTKHWTNGFYYCGIYMILIFGGQHYMANRPKFELRGVLSLWNTLLAAFSIIGFTRTAPEMIHVLKNYGFYHSVCVPRYRDERGSPGLSTHFSRSYYQLLMSIQARYACFRSDFLIAAKHFVTSEILTELKNEYANKIDSKRKLENIDDIEGLIKILEKRDVLNYDNIEPLHLITKRYCNDSFVYKLLMNYEKWLKTVPPLQRSNMYLISNEITLRMKSEYETCDRINQSHQSTSGTYTANVSENEDCRCKKHPGSEESRSNDREEKLIQDVLLKLSERLGHGWRDVTRFMNIRESQIDEIENKYSSSLKEQSYQALKICISQYDSNTWKVPLLRGLRKGRRNDLKEMLEDLILIDN